MGRRFPTNDNTLIHPLFSLSFIAAVMAATIALITTLCGVRFRRRSPPKPPATPSPLEIPNTSDLYTGPHPTTTTTSRQSTTELAVDKEGATETKTELPLPPKMQTVNQMRKSASERKLSSSLSMKVSRSLSVARINRDQKESSNHHHHHHHNHKKNNSDNKGKLKCDQDSIWTKTIILGEKCRVPDEDDDAVLYDGNGNRISAYHPKASTSMSLSRQVSFSDPDELIVSQQGK